MPDKLKDLKPDDLLTPAEALNYFPQLGRLGVQQGDIGNFRRVFALMGDPVSKRTGVRISVRSLVRLLKLINCNLNEMLFDFSQYPNLDVEGPDFGDKEAS